MKRNSFIFRIITCLLCITLLSSTVVLFSSCGKKIKDLSPYRAEFKELIEQSFAINDILFGEGLPVYSREESMGELHYSKEKTAEYVSYFKETVGKELPEQLYTDTESKFRLYHWLYRDPELTKSTGEKIYVCKYSMTYYLPEGTDDEGNPDYDMVTETKYALQRENASAALPSGISVGDVVYTTKEGTVYYDLNDYKEPVFEYEYDESDNEYYDVCRLDGKYIDILSIKAAAEQVYSMDYLTAIYSSVFDGIRSDFGNDSSSVLLARYIEEAGEEGGTVYLRKSNITEPLYKEHRTYDYETMQIAKPYNKDRVNVTVEAYGTYFSSETKQIETGKHTVRLSFVLQNGVWRLDSPTY
ncbi:MAG: hypothetical protein J6B77_02370 [Clostridia bacterium]|nr:hypothetical protein [Clostridia bacterium]